MKKKLVIAEAWASLFLSAFAEVMISQTEVDAVVSEEILLSMHPDDAQASVDYLKSKGVSDHDIAESVVQNLKRDFNCVRDESGNVRANAAIYWLERLGDRGQVSNLLFVAQASTNAHAAAAVRAYYRRTKDGGGFVELAEPLLMRPGMNQLKATVWDILNEEAKGPRRAEVVAMARRQLLGGFVNLYYADRILSRWHPGYAKSPWRRGVLKCAAEDNSAKILFPQAHEALRKRLLENPSK